jgi:ArsR family transcriptional regulator
MQEPKDIVTSLAALAHRHRLGIFRLLVKCGPPGMAASDIANEIGANPTNTSFHLKELSRAGLLGPTREGRYIRYAVNVDATRKLFAYLTQHCWQGDADIFALPRGLRMAAKSRRR